MHYKIKGAIRRNKKNFIIFSILWIFIAIVFVSPLCYSYHMATLNGGLDVTTFIQTFTSSMTNPFGTIINIFTSGATSSYFSALLVTTIFISLFFFIGFARSAPKNEYTDIEHGSSDWSQRGEQYKVLDKDKGIVLAENNYLPLNKIGNINVLVVGRIRSW